MTLPQEQFDLIERAAVSKPPQRVVNPRSVQGVIEAGHPLNFSTVVRGGASTMTSSLERKLALYKFVRPEACRFYTYPFVTTPPTPNINISQATNLSAGIEDHLGR